MTAFFDTHCHLDVEAFAADHEAVVARAAAAGVTRILVPAIRPATWPALAALRDQHRGHGVVVAIGVHPQVVPVLSADERAAAGDPDRLAEAALRLGAVAIGECGLDGATGDKDEQERVFRAHVRAARAARLPLVVHVLRAHDAAPRVLAEEGAREVGGVLHSYSGGAGMVAVYARLGLSFSFAGPITYEGARRPIEAARAVPDDRLLLETDAPDQAPAPFRGGRCEPAQIVENAAGLARARGATVSEIAASTWNNASRLFRVA